MPLLRSLGIFDNGFYKHVAPNGAFMTLDYKHTHDAIPAGELFPARKLLVELVQVGVDFAAVSFAASSCTPQEVSCPRVLRIGEDLFRWPLLGNQPLVKEDNSVGDLASEAHFVSDHDHGHAFVGQIPQDI